MAKDVIFILYIINCSFRHGKNFQNWLTFHEVIAKSSTPRFFLRHSPIIVFMHSPAIRGRRHSVFGLSVLVCVRDHILKVS